MIILFTLLLLSLPYIMPLTPHYTLIGSSILQLTSYPSSTPPTFDTLDVLTPPSPSTFQSLIDTSFDHTLSPITPRSQPRDPSESQKAIKSTLSKCVLHATLTLNKSGSWSGPSTSQTTPILTLLYHPPSVTDESSESVPWVCIPISSNPLNLHPFLHLPRKTIHDLNLLHPGVGLTVTSPCSSSLYCHRRSSKKRVFPSMFDMLIGGVSSSGEDPHTTAAREVGEELGLTRAEGLSGPLFTAGVCTGYNRCVVTCFNYQVDLEVESITHQDSEVGWGGWVCPRRW